MQLRSSRRFAHRDLSNTSNHASVHRSDCLPIDCWCARDEAVRGGVIGHRSCQQCGAFTLLHPRPVTPLQNSLNSFAHLAQAVSCVCDINTHQICTVGNAVSCRFLHLRLRMLGYDRYDRKIVAFVCLLMLIMSQVFRRDRVTEIAIAFAWAIDDFSTDVMTWHVRRVVMEYNVKLCG